MRLLLADLILLLHAAIAAVVVVALPLIVIGNRLRWAWVNGPGFRLAHLAAIGIVAGQALVGMTCPLTTLESWLRQTGGGTGYGTGFIEHWVGRALFYSAPTWVFTTAYSAYAVLVAWAWRAYPPAWRHDAAGAGR